MDEKNNQSDFVNARALYVLKIITMSFAILACVVIATVMLTRWIMDLNNKMKESNTKMAKAAARLNKFRKERIKHILRQRRLQLKEEKEDKKRKEHSRAKKLTDGDDNSMDYSDDDLTGDARAINDFDNDLDDIMLDDED